MLEYKLVFPHQFYCSLWSLYLILNAYLRNVIVFFFGSMQLLLNCSKKVMLTSLIIYFLDSFNLRTFV